MRERPSSRLPSEWLRLCGSFETLMPAEAMARAIRSFGAWCLADLPPPSYRQNHEGQVHRPKLHSGNDVEHTGSNQTTSNSKEAAQSRQSRPNQTADRLRFVPLRRRVSDHRMIWTRRKANHHYVIMRLPKRKPTPTVCSSWTSPELGLPRYLDGPKIVVLAAECRGLRRKMWISPPSMTAKRSRVFPS